MSTAPKISVIVATYNRRPILQRILATIVDQDFPADAYEIVIAIDGSNDGTAEYLRGISVDRAISIIEQPNRGAAAARNAALRVARGELVLFLDDDLLCDRSLLKEHAAAHEDGGDWFAFGPVLASDQSPDTVAAEIGRAYMQVRQQLLAGPAGTRWPLQLPTGANSSVKRSLLTACGGFDERLRLYEDPDLALRLAKLGVRPRYLSRALTHQVYVKSSDDLVRSDAYWAGRNQILLCRKHPEFRPQSFLARLRQGRGYKRLLREAMIRAPLSPEPLLRVAFLASNGVRRLGPSRPIANLLLRARIGVVRYRSALRELGSWQAMRREFGMQLPILLYHHVGPSRPGSYRGLTIAPEIFRRQMRYLKEHGYTGIGPGQWRSWCLEGTLLPKKPVIITFDDAYADIADHALPILREYGFGATVFVVTGQIGGTNVWDAARGYAAHPLMSAEQIRYWAGQGIGFGAHSRSHTDLTQLDPSALDQEIRGSANDLAALLGAPGSCFAYPYGRHNQAVRECVKATYEVAFAGEGLSHLGSDLHTLSRLEVLPSDSMFMFRCNLGLGWNPLNTIQFPGFHTRQVSDVALSTN